MIRFLLFSFLLLVSVLNAAATVTLQLEGEGEPVTISAVYLREGVLFLPLREILPPLHLHGEWDGAKHLYRIHAPSGEIVLAPGSRQLRYNQKVVRLGEVPRIIAGELCVPEAVVRTHLPELLNLQVSYINLQEGDTPKPPPKRTLVALRNKVTPMPQIIIDPGHGGDDPGAISPDGIMEKDLSLALALQTEKSLKMEGLTPLLLRNGDYGVTLRQRRNMLLATAGESLLLSLHVGAWRNSEAQGCTLYIPPVEIQEGEVQNEGSIFAEELTTSLSRAGFTGCVVERAPLLPLVDSPFPSVLIEFGYLTNPDELQMINSQNGREKIASALVSGLKKYADERQRRINDVPASQ